MNRYVSKIPGIILVAFFLLIQPANSSEKAFIIKMATLAPEGSSWMKTFHALNGEVMKETGNNVQFRIYPGGVLGDEPDVLRKININQIQGAALTSGGLSSIFDEIIEEGRTDWIRKRLKSNTKLEGKSGWPSMKNTEKSPE